jgi:hypothetical protein
MGDIIHRDQKEIKGDKAKTSQGTGNGLERSDEAITI